MGEEALRFEPVPFAAIDGWQDDDHAAAFHAFLRSCGKAPRKPVCAAAIKLAKRGTVSGAAARAFFEAAFVPHRFSGTASPGLLTGYYEPEVEGARKRGGRFQVPVYARPADLVAVKPEALRARYNETFTAMRRTRDGLVPYHTREEIDRGALEGRGLELLYLADPVELFFLQVQGSGRVRLTDGSVVHLGYAGKNGYPYTSIGKRLVEMGVGEPKDITMESIKAWLRADPARGQRLMWENRSYIFFEERRRKGTEPGPVGAQGVALTPGRSLAVDASIHALGLPIFVEAPQLAGPDGAPFRRLTVAQDVGSAIKGPERGDIFWGSGERAGAIAGVTRAPARFTLLLPKEARGG